MTNLSLGGSAGAGVGAGVDERKTAVDRKGAGDEGSGGEERSV